MDSELLDFLTRVAAGWLTSDEAIERQAAKWIQKWIYHDLEGGRKRHRRRKVTLVGEAGELRGGDFWVDEALLREAEDEQR